MAIALICPKQSTPAFEDQPWLFRKTWWIFFYNLALRVLGLPMIQDTHANRVNYDPEFYFKLFYFETDRDVFYISQEVNGVWTWVYSSGEMRGTLSPDLKPTGLGTNDEGFLFYATDFFHKHRWTGSAWEFAPGDPGSKFIVEGIAVPLGGLWQLCDGTAVTVDQANGTTASVTTPDTTGDIFIQGGTYTGTRKAAVRPTWETGAKTADETSEFDSPAVTEAEDTHVHNINPPTQEVQSGTGQVVAADAGFVSDAGSAHVHEITNSGAPQLAHSHNLTDALSQLKVPGETTGAPLRINLPRYMRR